MDIVVPACLSSRKQVGRLDPAAFSGSSVVPDGKHTYKDASERDLIQERDQASNSEVESEIVKVLLVFYGAGDLCVWFCEPHIDAAKDCRIQFDGARSGFASPL